MNLHPRDKQIDVIAALTEGMGISAAARLVGVNRETVAKLALRSCHSGYSRAVIPGRRKSGEPGIHNP